MTVSPIPVELLHPIFSFACMVDSRTGCALNATSRTFRDVCISSSVDIQCVSIHGADKMRRFTDTLSRRENCRVRSLLLSDDTEYKPGSEVVHSILTLLHALSRSHLRVLHVSLNVPGHLRSMSPPTDSVGRPVCWLPICFPSLVDLRLSCHLHHSSFPYTSTETFPALRSLRVNTVSLTFNEMFPREFPNLVELTLCVPFATPPVSYLITYLEGYCRPGHFLPPSLRTLTVYLESTDGRGHIRALTMTSQWREDFAQALLWTMTPDEQDRVVVWCDGRWENPLEMEVEGRKLVVYPPPVQHQSEGGDSS
ncbi:hypothetical protein EIP91_004055 [Steccherinum ochraceum]|uniref:F-box domain-containing protein n=1 Tax=Steccherinum ochraceum TaxID=92696 RepID=A0A4R0R9G5_9APHY|nr:hypothetical protein EIP91_004055 [Steccherinum ochraceum]